MGPEGVRGPKSPSWFRCVLRPQRDEPFGRQVEEVGGAGRASALLGALLHRVGRTNPVSGREFVFVREATEPISSSDGGWPDPCERNHLAARIRDVELEGAVRALSVVVVEVGAQYPLELAAAEDQQPVEALLAHRADEALEQHVDPPQRHSLDREEVAGDHARHPFTDEIPPRRTAAARCRRDPLTAEDVADRGLRDREPELFELADDPPVTPARVLARQPQNQCDEIRIDRGRPGPRWS